MSGRMGHEKVTTQNVTVHAIDVERGLILLKGAVPGPKGGLVLIRNAAKGASQVSTVDVVVVKGDKVSKKGSAELPAELFDVQVNIPLIHQVVVAQLAAARQGTHKVKRRARCPVVAPSRTARRAPVAPVRVRPARRSSPVVASCTAPRRATTASGPRRR